MTPTIWKFTIPLDISSVTMPRGAKVLTVQDQGGIICLWAEVDLSAPVDESHTFYVVGTGHRLKAKRSYIGTVQQPPFVWHVYELLP